MEDADATMPVPRPLPSGTGGTGADRRVTESGVMGLFDAVPEAGQKTSRHWLPPSAADLQQALPQYEITGFIARGGMGAVYKGVQRSLRRTVAIKVLPHEIEDADLLYAERFKREAQSMARLTHPNIVTVHDAGETEQGLLYFVMEFIEGTDLVQLIASEGRIEPQRALSITVAVCEALAFAHAAGIIHRDIKPSNIMLDKNGWVKVADFGLAKMINVESTLLTGSREALGTADFISPESLIAGTVVDGRADVYAVGVMLYQMLTGTIPRGRFKLPSGVIPQINPRLDAIVDKAMQTDPDHRYATALQMRDAVVSAATGTAEVKSRRPLLIGIIGWAVVAVGLSAWLLKLEPKTVVIIAPAAQFSFSNEPWQDVLAVPTALTLEGGVERTPEGLLFTDEGFATYGINQESKRNGAIRMVATFGGMNPALRGRVTVSDGVYEISVRDSTRITLSCYDNATSQLTELRNFPLSTPLKPGQDYELELRTVGQILTVKLNGEVLGTVTDGTLQKGLFGVGVSDHNGTPALVKAIEVLDLDAR